MSPPSAVPAATADGTRGRTAGGPPARGHRPDIQALRALAVMLVVGYHLWPGRLPGGYVGVDVFFVVSGFLITSHLLREGERTGRVDIAQFWARRALRLLPASLVVILTTTVATLLWVPESRWEQFLSQALGSALYVQNWVLAQTATDYSASGADPSAFQHFWSLSVEEQFYLVLPLLLIALVGRFGAWRRAFALSVVAITVASLVWSVHYTAVAPEAAYFVTTTRVWELGVGAIVAIIGTRRTTALPSLTAWVGTGLILFSALTYSQQTPFPGAAALVPVLGTALLLATTRHDTFFRSVAELSAVQRIGDASYSIYLWHWPLLVVAPFVLGHGLGLIERVGILMITLLLSFVSLRWVEEPWRSGPGRVRLRDAGLRFVLLLQVVTLLLVAVGFGLLRHHQAESEAAIAALRADVACFGAAALKNDCATPPVAVPALAALSQEDGNNFSCWTSSGNVRPNGCRLNDPDEPTLRVVAVGDSHSNSLIPAYERMAEQRGWRMDAFAKAGCYPLDAPIQGRGADTGPCREWGRALLEEVRSGDYDVVLVTHDETIEAVGADRSTRRANTVEGLRRWWQGVVDSGSSVVALRDVPRVTGSDLACAETEEAEEAAACRVPRDRAYPAFDSQRVASRGLDDVTFLDTSDLLCGNGDCPLVIGGVRVYFNAVHVTATFAETLAPFLGERIESAALGSEE